MLDQMVDGCKSLLPAIGIVIAAFIFKCAIRCCCRTLYAPQTLPAMVFLAMAFAMGSSWGIFPIPIPLA